MPDGSKKSEVEPVLAETVDPAQARCSDADLKGNLSGEPPDKAESETAALHGSLPPDNSGGGVASPIIVDKIQTHDIPKSSIRQVLSDWGPWKRWNLYRRLRKQELAEPAFWREHDPEKNTRGRLPDDERVQVPVIWVAELYAPSTVAGLLEGIANLGWEYGRSRDDSLSKWLSDVRQGRLAGWKSLGPVFPPDDAHFMRERTASLPEGVRVSLPILISVTPSVTALVAAFLLSDESADKLNAPLNASYSTRTLRDPRFHRWDVVRYLLGNGSVRFWRRIYDPDHFRRDAAKSSIRAMEQECIDWVRRYLPGTFSSLDAVSFPTAILFVTEEIPPLTEAARAIRAFDALSINRDYDAWDSTDWPGGRLVLPRSWDDEGSRLVFACRRRDAFPDQPGDSESRSNLRIAQRADEHVRGLLSRWALTCMLDHYHQTLAALRDRAAGKGTSRPVHDLKKLRSLTRKVLFDIGTSAQEVEEFVEAGRVYRHDIMEMQYVRSRGGKHPDLLRRLGDSQRYRTRQIQRESTLLQSTLSVSTNVSQTISNIRIQRLVVLLTIISIGIAAWALFLTLKEIPRIEPSYYWVSHSPPNIPDRSVLAQPLPLNLRKSQTP